MLGLNEIDLSEHLFSIYDEVVCMNSKIERAALSGASFQFRRADGSIIYPACRLLDDSRIEGAGHPNETSWDVQDGALLFLDADGSATTKFDYIEQTPIGDCLHGVFLPKRHQGYIHILQSLTSMVSSRPAADNSPSFAELRHLLEGGIFGKRLDSFNMDSLSWLAAGIASSRYATAHMSGAARHVHQASLLQASMQEVTIDGLVLEFGVFSGSTLKLIANNLPKKTIYGFDSFQGLPEAWRSGFGAGAFSVHRPEGLPDNAELVIGWFDRTLPDFLSRVGEANVAFVHIDCDLYSSTQTVLAGIADRIVPGTIIVFDEYLNYPEWEQHEYRAWQEFVASRRLAYKYIGYVPSHQQVAIRVVDIL